MTLARTAPESFSSSPSTEIPSLAEVMKTTSSSVSRFNLRKRNVISEKKKPQVNLSSYNSAFLSGLFADVARVASSHPSTDDNATAELTEDEEDLRQDDAVSVKRSRISLSRSISRCGRSFANLQVAISGSSTASPVSPLSPIEFFDISPKASSSSSRRCPSVPSTGDLTEENEPCTVGRENSLTFQLHCVSSSSETGGASSPRSIVADIAQIAFPHLPATVSDSSCNSSALSSGKVDQHVSTSETPLFAKEAYGWFVEMEDDDDDEPVVDSSILPMDRHAAAAKDLAFIAPTAPKHVNYDAEVEWAKAADTIDDVLGDFF